MLKLLERQLTNKMLHYVLYGIGVVAFFKIFKRPLRKVHKIGFAIFINRISVLYNKKLGYKKEILFVDLTRMSRELNRPLELLEIGAGSGANFKYYPKGTNVSCVDPNPYFTSYIQQNAKPHDHVRLGDIFICKAEDMAQVVDNSVDAVVCTLVLCSVDNIDQCLTEVKRVLRPGGKFFYMEHVRDEPGTFNYTVQWLLRPMWAFLCDGCQLTRDIWRNISEAGFTDVKQEKFKVNINQPPKSLLLQTVLRPHLLGVATK